MEASRLQRRPLRSSTESFPPPLGLFQAHKLLLLSPERGREEEHPALLLSRTKHAAENRSYEQDLAKPKRFPFEREPGRTRAAKRALLPAPGSRPHRSCKALRLRPRVSVEQELRSAPLSTRFKSRRAPHKAANSCPREAPEPARSRGRRRRVEAAGTNRQHHH